MYVFCAVLFSMITTRCFVKSSSTVNASFHLAFIDQHLSAGKWSFDPFYFTM